MYFVGNHCLRKSFTLFPYQCVQQLINHIHCTCAIVNNITKIRNTDAHAQGLLIRMHLQMATLCNLF